jgi:mannose-6-phosphate isomerase
MRSQRGSPGDVTCQITYAEPVATSDVRPWGSWHVLDEGEGFKVKRIVVNPASRLSLQRHEHRAEHWVVVSGTATCTVGADTVTLAPGDTVDVEIGQAHRIANLGEETLVIIEVQRGSYTGEDDIVRIEDDYGRTEVS